MRLFGRQPGTDPYAKLREQRLQKYGESPVHFILDSYVLDVIGCLRDDRRTVAQQASASAGLPETLNLPGDATWQACAYDILQHGPDDILPNWQAYQQAARDQGKAGDALQFAAMMVDTILGDTPDAEASA